MKGNKEINVVDQTSATDGSNESYVDTKTSSSLKTDCMRVMTGSLNMNSRSKNYVKQSQVHESTHAADVNFINTTIDNNNKQTATNYQKYVNDRLNQSVGSTDLETHLYTLRAKVGSLVVKMISQGLNSLIKTFISSVKKTYEMKLNLDSSQGCYSSHVGLNMYEVVQRQFLGFQLINLQITPDHWFI